eukprot:TRINITY_DN4673_c0_g1_i1.p1 TRINITY_DN4673_c0_g1~~TRINITY_DN4673_c0_g1_i1.p1  ORF type:complete len:586 (-),score=130.99 TRINITY_DN4673_c0_g1_i1:321-2078(-)
MTSKPNIKYVLVTGGVLSGIGKGVIASSTGLLLKMRGLRVTAIKIDPYINLDAGLMSPFEHGEVFVLDDGGEVDLDLGNYERFLDITLTANNNLTTGKVYQQVIERERRGDYLGKTVQVVPHITNAIQNWIQTVSQKPVDDSGRPADVCVIELGGTVGDIESMPFVEALRQFQFSIGLENICHLHVSLVPVIGVVGEQKTKPTQHGVQQLRALGLTPDLLMCRSGQPLEPATKEKLSLFCHVPTQNVIGVHDVSNIYRVPLLLKEQNVADIILGHLRLLEQKPQTPHPLLSEWMLLANRADQLTQTVKIALVGKYTDLADSYLSVVRSLQHASLFVERKLEIIWVESHSLQPHTVVESQNEEDKFNQETYDKAWALLKSADGIIVPGGFGDRGVQGKVFAIQYARENKIPYLGICLGMQLVVVEFARNVLKMEGVNSAEFAKTCKHEIIIPMPEVSMTHLGGTMRLGSRRTIIQRQESKIARLYGNRKVIDERHRHRYEVNTKYLPALEEAGLQFVGHDETRLRMEIVELDSHPYFVATQFHPEFKSRPTRPSPPFHGLLLAASGQLEKWLEAHPQNSADVLNLE